MARSPVVIPRFTNFETCWRRGTVQLREPGAREMRAEHDIELAGVGVPVQAAAASSTARLSAKVVITPGRLRTWGWLSALSLVDQGLTSGASFGVNLLLARWMAPEVYGAFAV